MAAFAIAGFLLLQQTFAAPANVSGSCSASPNPAKQYEGYTVSANGLSASHLYNVYTSDKVGTQWSSAMSDAGGNLQTTGYASYAGQYTVKVTDGASKKRTPPTVATCSFEAR
jgi:hypothetical protein